MIALTATMLRILLGHGVGIRASYGCNWGMASIRSKRSLLLLLAMIPVACSRPSAKEHAGTPPAIGYGSAMAEVARRFEIFGRASAAGRFELGDYELGEIDEQFTETLPHAGRPKEGHPEVLDKMVTAFVQTNIPDLRRSVAARDRTRVSAAFERAAEAYNACHQASGHGFIEVPSAIGQTIPNTDPVATP